MSQLTLGIAAGPVNQSGDPLDRFYTPDRVAEACVALLHRKGWLPAHLEVMLEPSVGGGSFARALNAWRPEAYLIGLDLDAEAPWLPRCNEGVVTDLLDFEPVGIDVAVGNPPFGGPHDPTDYIGARHARHLLDHGVPVVALLLPLWWVGVARVDELLLADYPPVVYRLRWRPWPTVREVALYCWATSNKRRSLTISRTWIDWR